MRAILFPPLAAILTIAFLVPPGSADGLEAGVGDDMLVSVPLPFALEDRRIEAPLPSDVAPHQEEVFICDSLPLPEDAVVPSAWASVSGVRVETKEMVLDEEAERLLCSP